jgi:hypothetical protein
MDRKVERTNDSENAERASNDVPIGAFDLSLSKSSARDRCSNRDLRRQRGCLDTSPAQRLPSLCDDCLCEPPRLLRELVRKNLDDADSIVERSLSPALLSHSPSRDRRVDPIDSVAIDAHDVREILR